MEWYYSGKNCEEIKKWDLCHKKLINVQGYDTQWRESCLQQRNGNCPSDYWKRDIQMDNKILPQKIMRDRTIYSQNRTTFRIGKKLNSSSNKRYLHEEYERKLVNFSLLQKIKNTKTNYSTKKMAENYNQNQKYKSLVSKFPVRCVKKAKRAINLQFDNNKSKHNQKSDQTEDSNYQRENDKEKSSWSKFRINSYKNTKQRSYSESSHQEIEQFKKRIIRIYGTIKIQINEKIYRVSGTHYNSQVLVKIMMDNDQFSQIAISSKQFALGYESSFSKLCQSIRYDDELHQFYFI